jgi:hypothetical protein
MSPDEIIEEALELVAAGYTNIQEFASNLDRKLSEEDSELLGQLLRRAGQEKFITLSRGGTAERVAHINEIQIPDLWHVAQAIRNLPDFEDLADELGDVTGWEEADDTHLNHVIEQLRNINLMGGAMAEVPATLILEAWYTALDLQRHIREL